ncbi:putative peptidase S10, serine carboxypeptidase, alpha/Beta hydrolase [Helianthus anomalus]
MYVVIIDRTNKVPSVTVTEYRRVASMIFLDIPAGVGFSYAKTKQGWLSSDSVVASHASAFIRKFLINHPMFLNNPLYIAGISYMGIINPLVTLQLYEGNERGDQPWLNIQVSDQTQ